MCIYRRGWINNIIIVQESSIICIELICLLNIYKCISLYYHSAYPFDKCNTTATLNFQVAVSSCVSVSKLTGKCYPSTTNALVIDGVKFTNTTQLLFDCITGQAASSTASSSSCFAGSETVMLASGNVKTLSTVQVGDAVAVASMDGAFAGYSPVIAVPHAANTIKATFAQIVTVSGRDIKMTPDHLVMGGACNGVPSLVQAGSLKAGECVQTVSGVEVIASVKSVVSQGIYTIVTKHDGLLIVNGIVASPFAVNHLVANSFYNILRLVYSVFPFMSRSPLLARSMEVFGDLAAKIGVFV